MKWLKQAEKKGNEEQLHEFWNNWIKVVGPRQGKPRTGIFPVVQYIEFVEHRSGRRNEQVARQLTKKQFITCYVDKGMEASWGEKEWNRRLTDDNYVKDTDPECGLLTMAATVHVQARSCRPSRDGSVLPLPNRVVQRLHPLPSALPQFASSE